MEDGMRTRSFRDEDYSNRRAFLRSYPLQWGEQKEEEEREDYQKEPAASREHQASLKTRLAVVLQWGGATLLLLKRWKRKIGCYSVTCGPFGFNKPSHKLLPV
ncbi:unnamed protein product [Musa acuminata subsp. burmannicoides]